MTIRVLLAIEDEELASQAAALLREGDGAVEVERAATAAEAVLRLSEGAADVVLLHASLGGAPAVDVARRLALSAPGAAVVLLVGEARSEVLKAALQAGVRDVVSLPLAFEELRSAVDVAAGWAGTVRDSLSGIRDAAERRAGMSVVLAGSKGGVGTTTLAVHLALAAAQSTPSRSVCLVDFDLQTGDVRTLLGVNPRRSVADLLDVTDALSERHLAESLFVHPSTLRVLLTPAEGEQAEDLDWQGARRVLSLLRAQFDIVVVDAGSVMTEAAGAAVELADRALVVATPDVLALQGANRLVSFWERLQVRKDDVAVVLNRVSRQAEVQPELAARMLAVPLTEATVPAAFEELEAAVNTGSPERVGGNRLRSAVARLAAELGLVRGAESRSARRRRPRAEAGWADLDVLAITPVMIAIVVMLFQFVIAGMTFNYTIHAARQGAHEHSRGGDVRAAVLEDLPPAWRRGAVIAVRPREVEVTLPVPALIPSLTSGWRVTLQAGATPASALPVVIP